MFHVKHSRFRFVRCSIGVANRFRISNGSPRATRQGHMLFAQFSSISISRNVAKCAPCKTIRAPLVVNRFFRHNRFEALLWSAVFSVSGDPKPSCGQSNLSFSTKHVPRETLRSLLVPRHYSRHKRKNSPCAEVFHVKHCKTLLCPKAFHDTREKHFRRGSVSRETL